MDECRLSLLIFRRYSSPRRQASCHAALSIARLSHLANESLTNKLFCKNASDFFFISSLTSSLSYNDLSGAFPLALIDGGGGVWNICELRGVESGVKLCNVLTLLAIGVPTTRGLRMPLLLLENREPRCSSALRGWETIGFEGTLGVDGNDTG